MATRIRSGFYTDHIDSYLWAHYQLDRKQWHIGLSESPKFSIEKCEIQPSVTFSRKCDAMKSIRQHHDKAIADYRLAVEQTRTLRTLTTHFDQIADLPNVRHYPIVKNGIFIQQDENLNALVTLAEAIQWPLHEICMFHDGVLVWDMPNISNYEVWAYMGKRDENPKIHLVSFLPMRNAITQLNALYGDSTYRRINFPEAQF